MHKAFWIKHPLWQKSTLPSYAPEFLFLSCCSVAVLCALVLKTIREGIFSAHRTNQQSHQYSVLLKWYAREVRVMHIFPFVLVSLSTNLAALRFSRNMDAQRSCISVTLTSMYYLFITKWLWTKFYTMLPKDVPLMLSLLCLCNHSVNKLLCDWLNSPHFHRITLRCKWSNFSDTKTKGLCVSPWCDCSDTSPLLLASAHLSLKNHLIAI